MPRGIYDRTRTTVDGRADEVRQERRKKPGIPGADPNHKLALDVSALNREVYRYRHVRSDRVQRLYREDWDIAPEGKAAKPDSTNLGEAASVIGGTEESGAPYDMVLMRKRNDWYERDQKEKQAPLDAIDAAIRRGQDHGANELRGEGVYTPGGGNTVEQAGNTLD